MIMLLTSNELINIHREMYPLKLQYQQGSPITVGNPYIIKIRVTNYLL
jgi:hypothetical protein